MWLKVLVSGIILVVAAVIWMVWFIDWDRLEADIRMQDEDRMRGR